jgi:hypothetical protein
MGSKESDLIKDAEASMQLDPKYCQVCNGVESENVTVLFRRI